MRNLRNLGWPEIVWGFLALSGIWEIVSGLAAAKFTDRTLGWLPGQERVKFSPRWYHRALRVSLGLLVTILALFALVGIRYKR
jgi:hypothetical protein